MKIFIKHEYKYFCLFLHFIELMTKTKDNHRIFLELKYVLLAAQKSWGW